MAKTQSSKPPTLFRSILCPVDFSESSAAALGYGAFIARRSGGHLHVLTVNDPMLASAAAVAFADRDYAKQTLVELRSFVARALPAAKRDTSIRYAVDTGDVVRTITAAAERFRCDLIVMATHGLSGVEKAVIGSTTERMLRRASLPMLAVPPISSEATGTRGPARRWPGAAILAPLDLRERSARDVGDAALIARAFGTDLVLAHVVAPLKTPAWYRTDTSAHHRMQVAKAERELESLAKAGPGGVNMEVRVLTGRPADEIAALAAEERIGLVVMHRRKGPGLFGTRAGTIAAHVLRHAVTPVLALPDRALKR